MRPWQGLVVTRMSGDARFLHNSLSLMSCSAKVCMSSNDLALGLLASKNDLRFWSDSQPAMISMCNCERPCSPVAKWHSVDSP